MATNKLAPPTTAMVSLTVCGFKGCRLSGLTKSAIPILAPAAAQAISPIMKITSDLTVIPSFSWRTFSVEQFGRSEST